MREDMHPARLEAFRYLADNGIPVTVHRRPFRANREARPQNCCRWRVSVPRSSSSIARTTSALKRLWFFAITVDHDTQERVLKDMAPWHSADHIRDALTEDKTPAPTSG
jgi:hypothetical protein